MSSPLDRWTRLWSRLSRRRLRREVEEELDFHLDMLAHRFEAGGMDPASALKAARERFGEPSRMRRAALKEERSRILKHERALYMDNLRQDLKFTFRQLWKRPLFSGISLAMLALGIGATTAIFSVVYTILLKPLPFPESDRLVQIWESRLEQGWTHASVAPANFWDFQEMNRSFESMGAFRSGSRVMTGGERPVVVSVGQVSAGFFGQVLGVRPVLGRTFVADESLSEGESRVAVLGNRFWQKRFGSDPAAMGSRVELDGVGYTVVGVLPHGRPWLDGADVFVPMVQDPAAPRGSFEIAVVGRLKPGMTLEAGRSDLDGVARRLEEVFPDELKGIGVTVESADQWAADNATRRALWILLGAVGFLLMIACVNLANLLLARSTGRIRETAIRASTGASRARLIRQGLTESLILSLLGAGLGLALAAWGVRALTSLAPAGQIPGLSDVSINGWVLAFALGAGVLTGIVTGLVPAFQASGGDAASILRSGGRSAAGSRSQRRLRNALVSAEMALSLMLLVGAGLLARSFIELMHTDRGFGTDHRLAAALPRPGTRSAQENIQFLDQLVDRVEALPSVITAAAIHLRPLGSSSTGMGFARPDKPTPEGSTPWASWRLITPGYFETMGVPVLMGRDFTRDDYRGRPNGALPIIVSKRVAEQLWPGENPIGRTMTAWAGQTNLPAEILGVVGDMRERGIDAGPTFATYLPFVSGYWTPELVIHTTGEPTAVVPALRSILAELDPDTPLEDVATLEDMVGRSVESRRFLMVLVDLFAGLALTLALAGVYGVQAYSVVQQTQEIGVRVAIGASGAQVLRRVVFQAMRPAAVGVLVGLGGAWGLSRFMATMLFEVRPTDPTTYGGVAALVVGAALVAAWMPARRAARVDPVIAFRAE